MAISNIILEGFGSFGGGVNKLPTIGFGIGTPVTPPTTSGGFYIPGSVESEPTYRSSVESASTYPGRNDERVQ